MRKLIIYLFVLMLIFVLVACGKDKNEEATIKTIKATQSFGNQINQEKTSCVQQEEWLYVAEYDQEGRSQIVKVHLDKPSHLEVIYKADKGDDIWQVSVSGDLIFFIAYNIEVGDVLYRIKKDGTGKRKLEGEVDLYTVTNEEIYYSAAVDADGTGSVKAMQIDGSHKREILWGYELFGIDDGWLYVGESPLLTDVSGYKTIYKISPDGKKKEKVIDIKKGKIINCLVDGGQFFFAAKEEKEFYIKKKTHTGRESILANPQAFPALNKEGDWLFYTDKNKVYKIETTGKGKKKLVYSHDTGYPISNILLYNGDLLLVADQVVYMKKDGTIIKYDHKKK